MLVRPDSSVIKTIVHNVGKVIMGLGAAMTVPLALALALREWQPAWHFLIGILACFCFWAVTVNICRGRKLETKAAGMSTVALSWLAAMVMAAIPLFLSGHFGSFLDACFDSMSGLATTGLTVIHDLDHIAYSTNLWRHLIMFLGGQGIVVIVLTYFVSGSSHAVEMYLGEGREEKILPNAVSTARFIWLVSIVYLALGTLILWLALVLSSGMPPAKGLFHSICIFMAGYDTGGFTPMSQSIMFYHSFWLEIATVAVMMVGMMNFGVHRALWTGNRRELLKNVETRTLAVTISITVVLAVAGLAKLGAYPGASGLFRRGAYQIISGHTGTGFMTIYGNQFATLWGPLAVFGAIIAMALGGASCSTAGGIKALRVNINAKNLLSNIRKLLAPDDAVIVHKYHHIRDLVANDLLVRGVMLITLCYIMTYLLGALVLTMYGYPLTEALFESTSACANVGLTNGITSSAMPALVKAVFIAQMWMGRLEFISVFLLFGFLYSLARGR